MGLDITIYTDAKFVSKELPEGEAGEDLIGVFADSFPKTLGGMEEGYYEATTSDGFRAGSYSGYNAWRDALCRAVHGISAKEYWITIAGQDLAFDELINFADNEGIIGTAVCAKLAGDFDAYHETLIALGDDVLWDLERWREGLREAGNNDGFVQFH